MCCKHYEPGHRSLFAGRTMMRPFCLASAGTTNAPRTSASGRPKGLGEDCVLFIFYEFSGSYKYLKGFHRKISQEKKKKVSLNTKKAYDHLLLAALAARDWGPPSLWEWLSRPSQPVTKRVPSCPLHVQCDGFVFAKHGHGPPLHLTHSGD